MKVNCAICKEDCNFCNTFECKSIQEQLVLIRKKVSSHYVPPDMSALKILSEDNRFEFEQLNDEELEKLKIEILEQIKSELT